MLKINTSNDLSTSGDYEIYRYKYVKPKYVVLYEKPRTLLPRFEIWYNVSTCYPSFNTYSVKKNSGLIQWMATKFNIDAFQIMFMIYENIDSFSKFYTSTYLARKLKTSEMHSCQIIQAVQKDLSQL